jgi:hypothetical protein
LPVKGLVEGVRIGEKTFKAWGTGEEPVTFDMVAYLSLWQKTPVERVKTILVHNNPGMPASGWEVLRIWEQERSRKVDIKADAVFYEFVRTNNWRLRYTLGYADCLVGRHGEPTSGHRQEQGQVRLLGQEGRN